jgi:predicted transposase/invertase (TIGR01784 family)
MIEFKEKYLNPFTDYGFKRLFGEEPNKDLLLDFLNELLRETEGEIKEISYLPNERLPISKDERKAIFDLYCTNEKGEKFIVELQKTKQKYFKDRTLYYSTFPIQEQAIVGQNWTFELKNVYTIAILDFIFDHDLAEPDKYRYDVKLSDIETNKVFYDKLTFIYFEMPKFNKTESQLVTKFDKWLFVLRNLNKLDRIPVELKEGIFLKLFKTAEIAKLDTNEFKQYQESLNAYRDIKNSVDTAFEEGEIKGKTDAAKAGLSEGLPIDLIIKITGLTKEEIERLK